MYTFYKSPLIGTNQIAMYVRLNGRLTHRKNQNPASHVVMGCGIFCVNHSVYVMFRGHLLASCLLVDLVRQDLQFFGIRREHLYTCFGYQYIILNAHAACCGVNTWFNGKHGSCLKQIHVLSM